MAKEKKLDIKVRTKGAKKAKKDLKGVESGMATLGKAAAAAGAAFFAAKAIVAGLKAMIDLSAQQELAEKKLQAALGKTSKSLLDYATSLQKVSMFGDEATIEAMSLMAAFTKDEEALKKLTSATLDYAAATGTDLNAAAALVGRTFGTSMNAMSRYGVAVEGAAGSTERLESLTGNLNNMFAGQAIAQTNTMAGAIQQMKNASGDAAEALGDILAPVVISIAKTLKGAFEWAEKFLDGLNNLITFGNVVGKIEVDTNALLKERVENNRTLIDQLVIQKKFQGGLTDKEQEKLSFAQFFLNLDLQKLAVLETIAKADEEDLGRKARHEEIWKDYFAVQKELAEMVEREKAAREKAADFAAKTALSMATSAVMGDDIGETLKRAVVQMVIMVAQAKLYDYFMTQATGGINKISSGFVNFLFGASPTQAAPSPGMAATGKITINQNFGGMGVIDHNFAANSIIPAINKAISTGQARLG